MKETCEQDAVDLDKIPRPAYLVAKAYGKGFGQAAQSILFALCSMMFALTCGASVRPDFNKPTLVSPLVLFVAIVAPTGCNKVSFCCQLSNTCFCNRRLALLNSENKMFFYVSCICFMILQNEAMLACIF